MVILSPSPHNDVIPLVVPISIDEYVLGEVSWLQVMVDE